MGLEIGIWLIIITIAGILYFSGIWFRVPHLFLLGCAMLIGSGALLWGFNGLILQQQVIGVTDAGAILYEPIIVSMENIGLSMLSLILIAISIISALTMNFTREIKPRSNVYHF